MKKVLLVVATLATVAVSTAGINGALRLYGVAGGTAARESQRQAEAAGIKFVRLPIARTAPAMA